MSLNGMVRPCSCPASNRGWQRGSNARPDHTLVTRDGGQPVAGPAMSVVPPKAVVQSGEWHLPRWTFARCRCEPLSSFAA